MKHYTKEELEALPFRPGKDVARKQAEWKARLSKSKRQRDAMRKCATQKKGNHNKTK